MTVSGTKILAVIIVLIIVVGAITYLVILKPTGLSVSVGTSTSVGTAGSPITFTAIPSLSSASISSVVWNFGDGTNQTISGASATHTYTDGGHYLILAQVTATYQGFLFPGSAMGSNGMALFPLVVEPSLTSDQAQEASVPTIDFPRAANPTAPVFNAGDVVDPVGGFLEKPTNSNWTIAQYDWDFGNGNKQTVTASNETGDPVENVTATYSNPGLYPLSLTLITTSNGQTFSVSSMRTVAIRSSTLPFALLTTSSGVQNPGVITTAEVFGGGPYSWDPQMDYDAVGKEELDNIFQTLVQYNGSSTFSFIPYLAAALPTQENGISSDYRTYTFQIRNDQYFSNGDPVTAYDVWFSFARGLAFASGTPGTADWIQDQFLVPGVQNGTATVYTNNTWAVAMTMLTYDNATNTVTFHLNRPVAPTELFSVLADSEGGDIVDAAYAWSVGAGFNEANWDNYKNQANAASYNVAMDWRPVGSGPFMVQSFTPGQSVELVPNPHYGGVPGIPKQNITVVANWVKTPDTAILMLQDGQADVISGIPTSDFPAVQKLQSQGLVNIYNFPIMGTEYYTFNIKIDKELEAAQFGPGFNEPTNYFADLPTRLAWINAYDYAGYLNNIVGNAKYGTSFGFQNQGFIPLGMIYYVPPDQLGGLPAENLAAAKGNFSISAWANQKITVPIIELVGDSKNIAGAEEWAGILAQMSNGNINAKVVTLSFDASLADAVPNADPMGVSFEWSSVDYPDTSDYAFPMLEVGGWYPESNNWFVPEFAALAPSTPNDLVHVNGSTYGQDTVYRWINGNLSLSDASMDPAVRQQGYEIGSKLAIDMGLYLYLYQEDTSLYFRSWVKGYEMEENPISAGGGSPDFQFYWLTKG
jgi:ABC-type transport system substrate-binding protein